MYDFAAGSFHTQKLCSRLIWLELTFIQSIARWEARGRLSVRHNWTFSLSLRLRLRSHKRKSVEFGVFRRGVNFGEYFRGKGTSPTNYCWCQKTRVIALSCGIKISAVHHLILSQYTHLTDRQRDGQTDRQTELRQQYRALHYMQSHVNKNSLVDTVLVLSTSALH